VRGKNKNVLVVGYRSNKGWEPLYYSKRTDNAVHKPCINPDLLKSFV